MQSSFVLKMYELDDPDVLSKIIIDAKTMNIDYNDKFIKSYWAKQLFYNDEIDDRDIMINRGIKAIVASINNVTLGISIINTYTGSIELLVISRESRGMGIGNVLLRNSIQTGGHSLDVHVENIPAIKLYKKNKFRIVNAHGDYLKMRIPLC